MRMRITSTNVQFDNGGKVTAVNVAFQARSNDGKENVYGNIRLTPEEYEENTELPQLVEVVKEKIVATFTNK